MSVYHFEGGFEGDLEACRADAGRESEDGQHNQGKDMGYLQDVHLVLGAVFGKYPVGSYLLDTFHDWLDIVLHESFEVAIPW